MPELPEVETMRRDLERLLQQQIFSQIRVIDDRVIRGISGQKFRDALLGERIQSVGRRGKALIFNLRQDKFLLMQPMMTGHFIYFAAGKPVSFNPATKIIFDFNSGDTMVYNDHRLFGRISLVKDLSEVKFLRDIGPEPWDLTYQRPWLAAALGKRTVPIKTLLMNQQFLAGIGNIYASEILFKSGIKPQRRAQTLKAQEIDQLFSWIPKVLEEAIALRGTSMLTYRDTAGERGNFSSRVQVYGRENQDCYRCAGKIRKIVQAGRSTFFCATCQK